jgi:energy-coupling factor transporter ATP-binding protein EcfA2
VRLLLLAMAYTFTSLSPADFEDLSREVIGAEIGVRFEGFSAGPDGGADGRYAVGAKKLILQAKHYIGSQFASLKAATRRERAAIDELKPSRYLLTTSRPLTPANKSDLAKIIGPSLKSQGDIFGPADLNALLRKFPNVERSHIKLWLSSSSILERIIRSSVYAYTATSRADIEAKVRVYAQNPSFKEARDRLERDHVLIISGPPGVGKTTLAEMLAYAYIGEEWEFVAIRSLDDGFAEIVDAKKQIFFFDDFLGRVALDEKSLASKDSELVKLIKRVRKTSNARFILTTRAYIFEEAKRASESISDRQLEIATYVLDVGAYTRRIRARILYNHLYVAQLHKDKIRALLEKGVLPKIVDHTNYNPRIIEWMTDELNVRDIEAKDYVEQFMDALDHPTKIWDTAFRAHIPPKCRHLLITLFFCSEYGVEIEDLEQAFGAVNPVLSVKYNLSYSTKDFGESLKIAEGSFLEIQGNRISFINPSVRDYLSDYLKDKTLLEDLASTSLVADWAQAVWAQFCAIPELLVEERAGFVRLFIPTLGTLAASPVWQRQRHDRARLRYHDMYLAQRAELFFDWWKISEDGVFIQAILDLIQNPRPGFGSFDAIEIIRLISVVNEEAATKLPQKDELHSALENVLIDTIDRESAPDKLEKIFEKIDDERLILSEAVIDAANNAIEYQLDEMTSLVSDIDSGSTLNDHAEAVRALGARVNAAGERMRVALKAITDRIAEVEERASDADEPEFTGEGRQRHDVFDDDEIANLFSLLV